MAKVSRAEKQRKFLDAVGRGASAVEAAAYAGVARATVYGWAERDKAFEAAWQVAEGQAAGALRMRAYELAMGGNSRLLTWLLELAERRATGDGESIEGVGQIQIVGLKEGEVYGGDFIEFVSS